MPDTFESAAAEQVVRTTAHATEAGVTGTFVTDRVKTAESALQAAQALEGKEVTDAAIREGVSTIVDAGNRTAAETAAMVVQRHVEGGATAADLNIIRGNIFDSLKDDPAFKAKLAAGLGDPGVDAIIDGLIHNNPEFELVIRQELDGALEMESPEQLKVEKAAAEREKIALDAAFNKADRDLKVAQAELARLDKELAEFDAGTAKHTELTTLGNGHAEVVSDIAKHTAKIKSLEGVLDSYRAELRTAGLGGRRTAVEINADIAAVMGDLDTERDKLKDQSVKLEREKQLKAEREKLQTQANSQSAKIEEAERTKKQKSLEVSQKNTRITELTAQIDQHDQKKKEAVEAVYKRAAKKYSREQINKMKKVAYEQIGKWQEALPEKHARVLSRALKAKLFEEVDVDDYGKGLLWTGVARRHKGTHKEVRVLDTNVQDALADIEVGGVDKLVRETMTRVNDPTKSPPATYTVAEVNQMLLGEEGANMRKMAVASLIGTGELMEDGLTPEQKTVLFSTAEGEAILAESTSNEEFMEQVEKEAKDGGFAKEKPEEKVKRAIGLNPLLLTLLLGGVMVGSAASRAATEA